MRVLLVEDDPRLAELTALSLVQAGWAVDSAGSYMDAHVALRDNPYDVIALDLGLPDGDGLAFLRAMRSTGGSTPVVIVTARGKVAERVAGLNAGADDYLVKPFAAEELHARLVALCRRANGKVQAELELGPLRMDQASRMVTCRGSLLRMSRREAMLLELLLRAGGKPVPVAAIEASLSDYDRPYDRNAIDACVFRLRSRLKERQAGIRVENERGIGYRLVLAAQGTAEPNLADADRAGPAEAAS